MSRDALAAHLATGVTTICRAWIITRADGEVLGFTDHDRDLMLGSTRLRADAGLGAKVLAQGTGLSVDNTEAVGALSHDAICAEDLDAGRYDGAEVTVWLLDWSDPGVNRQIFRGWLGEVSHCGAEFRAELRGLSEPLNQPIGRAYGRDCSAVLGDRQCRVDMGGPGLRLELPLLRLDEGGAVLVVGDPEGQAAQWFTHGRLEVLSGEGAGLSAMIRHDQPAAADPRGADGATRRIALWQRIRARLSPGDMLRLSAGCDRSLATCRDRFANVANFRGFPHQPGEDWISSYPVQGETERRPGMITPKTAG